MLIHAKCHCADIDFSLDWEGDATSRIADHLYAVVNVNTFENVDPGRLRRGAADFEGEDIDARLACRKRNWIANVRIS